MANEILSKEGTEPSESSSEPTEGFKGTPPVENIDATDGDVSDDFSEEFGELALEMLVDDGEIEPDPEPEPVEEVLAQPEEPKAEEAEEPKPDELEGTEEAPKGEGEEQASQEPEPEKLTREEQAARAQVVQEEAQEARDKLVGQIEESITFTEDEIERLKTEPETVLPKMVANLYLDVHNAVMQSVRGQMPQLIQQVRVQQDQQSAATDAFSNAWKSLDLGNAEHMATIGRLGVSYRQMNPTATQQQFIREVGAQAMIALGIPLTAAMGLVEPQDEVLSSPYSPAKPASASPGPKAQSDNVYESLADEFLEDDQS